MKQRVLHWKPPAITKDGAACGTKRVPFTGNRAHATCKACLKVKVAK